MAASTWSRAESSASTEPSHLSGLSFNSSVLFDRILLLPSPDVQRGGLPAWHVDLNVSRCRPPEADTAEESPSEVRGERLNHGAKGTNDAIGLYPPVRISAFRGTTCAARDAVACRGQRSARHRGRPG